MKIGALRERCEILKRVVSPGPKGEPVKTFSTTAAIRGDWRQVNGRELLLSGAQMNVRQGTLLTRFYPKATESMFIRIKGTTLDEDVIYEVVTFNHADKNRSTLWTLSKFVG